MAKANSTRTKKHSAAAPAAVKAMLCHSDDREEAMTSVSNVLWFMAAVLREDFDFCGDQQMLDGAGLILETCSETLSHHIPRSAA